MRKKRCEAKGALGIHRSTDNLQLPIGSLRLNALITFKWQHIRKKSQDIRIKFLKKKKTRNAIKGHGSLSIKTEE